MGGESCTLTLYEESFYMHFFVVPKGQPEGTFVFPKTAGELQGMKEYVGLGTHFGGEEPGEPFHAAIVETYFPFEGDPKDFHVYYVFEHDEDEEAEKDDHPLLREPHFWTSSIGCPDGNPPTPDDSWINFAY